MSTDVCTIQLVESAEIVKNLDGTWTAYLGKERHSGSYFSCALWLYTHSVGE